MQFITSAHFNDLVSRMHKNLTRMHIDTQRWAVLRREHQSDTITFYTVTFLIAIIVGLLTYRL